MHRTTRAVAAMIVAIAVLAPAPVAAQEVPSDAATAGARALFEQGVESAQAGRWQEAADRFRQAFTLRQSPVIEYNLANALGELGRFLDAAQIFERTQSAADAPQNVRAQSREALARIEARLSVLIVHVEGPADGTQVRVDETERAAGEAIRLDPGQHSIVLLRETTMLDERRIELAAGRTEVTLRVPEEPAITIAPVPALRASPRTSTVGPPAPAPRRDAELRAWPLALGGAGLAVGVGGVALWFWQEHRLTEYEDDSGCHGRDECERDGATQVERGRDVALVGMVAGGALLATGVVWWFVDSEDEPDSAALACAPGVLGLECTGRF